MAGDARIKGKPRRNQFREKIEQDAGFQNPARQEVKPAAQRIGDWLRFEMKVKRREIAPDGVAAKFNQCRAEHEAKDQPTKQQENHRRRLALWKRTAIEQRTKEDCQK